MQPHLSYGGMCGTGLQSYTATVLNAAESVKKGLSIVGTFYNSNVSYVIVSYYIGSCNLTLTLSF